MKLNNFPVNFIGRARRRRSLMVALALVPAFLQPPARAAVVPVPEITTSDTTYIISLGDTVGPATSTTGTIMADGARLVISRAPGLGTTNLFAGANFASLAALNITGTNGGRVVFQDIHYDQDNRHAGVAEINTTYTNLTQLNVTGVDFMRISNGGPVNYNGVGGVFLFNKAGLTSTFTVTGSISCGSATAAPLIITAWEAFSCLIKPA
ncbi:hypothetical protein OH491_18225 [Termitidicoccus mucosus]|uniref:hypothetical protein n=1 Tax=Termitidicoccus mucosus TaxID=1184151 RepID=UPI003182C1D0